MTAPSNKVHDKFRERCAGLIDIPTNSKRAFDQFHVSRERLGTHDEYDPTEPNDWGGTGKYVRRPNSIMDNVRGAMGGLAANSSYKSIHDPAEPTDTEGSMPSYSSTFNKNPLTKKRGD